MGERRQAAHQGAQQSEAGEMDGPLHAKGHVAKRTGTAAKPETRVRVPPWPLGENDAR